jgi:hypothetical protein
MKPPAKAHPPDEGIVLAERIWEGKISGAALSAPRPAFAVGWSFRREARRALRSLTTTSPFRRHHRRRTQPRPHPLWSPRNPHPRALGRCPTAPGTTQTAAAPTGKPFVHECVQRRILGNHARENCQNRFDERLWAPGFEGAPETCGGVNQPSRSLTLPLQVERLTGERFRIYYEYLRLLTFWCCQAYCP